MFGVVVVVVVVVIFDQYDQYLSVTLNLLFAVVVVVVVVVVVDHCPLTLQVTTFGGRLVQWMLSRVLYRQYEQDLSDPTFLPAPPGEHAKIIWKDGRAVGFYTHKPKGNSEVVSPDCPSNDRVNLKEFKQLYCFLFLLCVFFFFGGGGRGEGIGDMKWTLFNFLPVT